VPFDNHTIKDVACGDFHNILLTDKGQVFSWGLASHGQLGIPKRKGSINRLLTKGGNKMTYRPFHIESLDLKHVTRITARRKMSLAFCSERDVYTWGTFPKGLALTAG